jgi:hypothetical protein
MRQSPLHRRVRRGAITNGNTCRIGFPPGGGWHRQKLGTTPLQSNVYSGSHAALNIKNSKERPSNRMPPKIALAISI